MKNKRILKKYMFYVYVKSSGQDVKRYPKGVRLDNRNVLRTPGSRTKNFCYLFLIIR